MNPDPLETLAETIKERTESRNQWRLVAIILIAGIWAQTAFMLYLKHFTS